MTKYSDILIAYQSATNYPDLVAKLIHLGIQSYTVDVVTETVLYRLADGENIMHNGNSMRDVEVSYNEKNTIQAIRNTQEGKSNYTTFLDQIAKAGIRFYEATLIGNKKRVTYIASGGFYQEMIPQ